MALTGKSLIRYGFEVNAYNANVFLSIGGPTLYGQLTYGFYTVDSFMLEVIRVLNALAPSRVFSYSVNRTINSGTEIRVTIAVNTGTFSLDFTQAATFGPTLGFMSIVYSGQSSYTSSASGGTQIIPEYIGYNYLGPEFTRQVLGSVNISASGLKEAVVFQTMQFLQVEFRYEPQAKVITQWTPFFDWAIQQKVFEFIPQTSSPTTYYEVTLEKSSSDSKGLGFKMSEMLPSFPFYYQTGLMVFRRQLAAGLI